MRKMSSKLYLVALATIVCPLIAFAMPSNSSFGMNMHQLTFLGSVDGKSYFSEETITATWFEADEICISSGMHLATFTSVAQVELLKNAANYGTFWDYHWTGGRDSLVQSQFVWKVNSQPLDGAVAHPLYYTGIRTCVGYMPEPLKFTGFSCSTELKILCET